MIKYAKDKYVWDPAVRAHAVVNPKWIRHLNVILYTAKTRRKQRESLHDTGVSNVFLDITPNAQATKAKTDT